MKFTATFTVLAGLLLAPAALAQDAAQVDQATTVARKWVALIDAANYSASWEQSAAEFQAAVSKPTWEAAAQAVRAPLGAVITRKLLGAQYTHSIPGAPAGEYVVIQFESSFEKKAGAIETVTPMKGKDGTWRVSGYFVR